MHLSRDEQEDIYSLINKVVDSVREENIVQIRTDYGSNFKIAARMLMEKRTKLFWTPFASHCINLIMEEIGRKKWLQ